MNFADLRFWECLLAALLVAAGFRWAFGGTAAVRDGRFDRWFLLILGLVLLGLVSWLTFVIALGVAVFTFVCLAWGCLFYTYEACSAYEVMCLWVC